MSVGRELDAAQDLRRLGDPLDALGALDATVGVLGGRACAQGTRRYGALIRWAIRHRSAARPSSGRRGHHTHARRGEVAHGARKGPAAPCTGLGSTQQENGSADFATSTTGLASSGPGIEGHRPTGGPSRDHDARGLELEIVWDSTRRTPEQHARGGLPVAPGDDTHRS